MPLLATRSLTKRYGSRVTALDELTLDLLVRPKLEPSHPSNNLSVELIDTQRFTLKQVRIRWTRKPPRHPDIAEDLGERGA